MFHWVDFENTFLDGGKMKLVEENSIIVYIISECLMKSKTIFINFEPPPFRGEALLLEEEGLNILDSTKKRSLDFLHKN